VKDTTMTDNRPITLDEGRDNTVLLTINRLDAADDLSTAGIRFVLKDSDCDPDSAGLVLTSADPTQITILTQGPAQITAAAFVPASSVQGTYPRFYLTEITSGAVGRPAMFGLVTVTNL
jgi:hypothetical protein